MSTGRQAPRIADIRAFVIDSKGRGGEPACFLIEKHFKRFVVGADCRNISLM